jgi:hypothetical protein
MSKFFMFFDTFLGYVDGIAIWQRDGPAVHCSFTKGHKGKTTHVLHMKYTARHIQRFLEQGKIDPELWKNHFPTLLPTQVPVCEECSEFKESTCPGGKDPVECLLAKKPDAEPGEDQKKKKHDPMLGLGVKGPSARGTARPRDQSKM